MNGRPVVYFCLIAFREAKIRQMVKLFRISLHKMFLFNLRATKELDWKVLLILRKKASELLSDFNFR